MHLLFPDGVQGSSCRCCASSAQSNGSQRVTGWNCCNGLHVIETLCSAFGCCRFCDKLLPFQLGLHQSLTVLCLLVFKGLLEQLDWFSHLRFFVAIVLPATFIDYIAIPADLHTQTLFITPVEHMQHVLLRLHHRSQVFQLIGQLESNHTRCTDDRIVHTKT